MEKIQNKKTKTKKQQQANKINIKTRKEERYIDSLLQDHLR